MPKSKNLEEVELESSALSKVLEARKESLFRIIQKCYDLSLLSTPESCSDFITSLEGLDKTKEDFAKIIQELNMEYMNLNKNYVPNFASLESFNDIYCSVKSLERTYKNNLSSSAALRVPTAMPRVELPPLKISNFNGDPSHWSVFYENFKSLIHNNYNLSKAQKIQYLIGHLSHRALTVCAGVTPSAENYDLIWDSLVNKYEDKRQLASNYLDQILNFKNIKEASSSSLESFTEKVMASVAAFKHLNLDDDADFIFTYLALSKLDIETVKLFEQSSVTDIPNFESLRSFINNHTKLLARTGDQKKPDHPKSHFQTPLKHNYQNYTKSKPRQSHSYSLLVNNLERPGSPKVNTRAQGERGAGGAGETQACPACGETPRHPLFRCSSFMRLNNIQRYNFIKHKNYCSNCLGFHKTLKCNSSNLCFICSKKHHTAIHLENLKKQTVATTAHAQTELPIATASLPKESVAPQTNLGLTTYDDKVENVIPILPTAIVYISNAFGIKTCVRILLDSGSMSNFITENCCKRLGLDICRVPISVNGIGGYSQSVIGQTKFDFGSLLNDLDTYSVQALVMRKITSEIPHTKLSSEEVAGFRDLPLADKHFDSPGEIDCLIGVKYFPRIFKSNKIMLNNSSVCAMETTLGYVIIGSTNADSNFETSNTSLCSIVDASSLDLFVRKFWELENVPNVSQLTAEEKECEEIFTRTHTRDENGRYKVELPFKLDPRIELGESQTIARRRLFNLEKRLDKNPAIKESYNSTIREYIDKNYLSLVNEADVNPKERYYMPHSAVYREDKTTSKVRIVIDASCKSASGKSLNDILHSGPNLQTNIFNLLIELRIFSIALSADIEKMFFGINLYEPHRKYQSILFRFDSNQPIQTYEFNRVSFGTTSSPYLAMRSIHQLAKDEAENYPLAVKFIPNNLYMDDFIGSVENLDKAKLLVSQLIRLFHSGGFNLTKWLTNNNELNQFIPEHMRATKVVEFDSESRAKIVGLRWKPFEDYFFFDSNVRNISSSHCTKREILSTAARCYDPLGLISPVVTYLKLLTQDCWKAGLDWDDPAPDSIRKRWTDFLDEFKFLNEIKIPRHIGIKERSYIMLLGFADSSEKSYGAAIYIRVSRDFQSSGRVTLLCSKSKLAPLSNRSLPRLELCACLLLAKLIKTVTDTVATRCQINQTFAFSDSTIALSWIHSQSYRWQTFVANRVSAIQELVPARNWRHVISEDNPSDIVSRPVTPKKLVNNLFWFSGPPWSPLPPSLWPSKEFNPRSLSELPEEKTASSLPCNSVKIFTHPYYDIALRVSSWNKLVGVIVYILRFIGKLKTRGRIIVTDLEVAEASIIKTIQLTHFDSELKSLNKNQECSPRIRKFYPFLDNNIIRVGGRLSNSNIRYQYKHPIILPSKDRIVELLIDYYHVLNLHTGPGLLLALLRQKYWILSARNVVRQRTQKCNICFRSKPRNIEPLMGQQPSYRVTEQIKPFWNTGVDYAGPIYITARKARGATSHKAYICLFICLATKAIHIELANDLSTESFIRSLKRFISRRGPVSVIHSDGGTNFLGAKRKLDELYMFLLSDHYSDEYNRVLINNKITFKNLPPYSPHMAGVWESQVKCVKTHLIRVIGSQILTYEEMNTVLIQIEALLNSRPLCVLSSDPSEPTALTPAHFLHNIPLSNFFSKDYSLIHQNKLIKRHELIEKLIQSFWNRWRVEYLNTLQARDKWNTISKPIQKGTVVLIREDNIPPLRWPLGIVVETHPGRDNITRVVTVRTASGTYKRPVVRMCPLPTQ